MTARIEFFWDCVSSYSYVASTQIERVAGAAGAVVQWRPFLLGAVFQATGNTPPARLPAKARYLFEDMRRLGRYYGIPVRQPEPFPTSTLLAQRVATAAGNDGELARSLCRQYWGLGRDINDPAVLREAITEAGRDASELLAAARSDAVRTRLRETTDEAVARGAFGAPTMFVGEAMFWGCDRFDLLRAHLDGRLSA